MKKIYISGKITGLDLTEAMNLFNFAMHHITIQSRGKNKPVNPFYIMPFFGIKTWFFYLINDLRVLRKCDSVYFLTNWSESRGARIEMVFAIIWGKELTFQK